MRTLYAPIWLTTALLAAAPQALAANADDAGTHAVNDAAGLTSDTVPHISESPRLDKDLSSRPTRTERSTAALPLVTAPVGRCVVGDKTLTAADAATCSRQGGIWNTDTTQPRPPLATATAKKNPQIHRADPEKNATLESSGRTGE